MVVEAVFKGCEGWRAAHEQASLLRAAPLSSTKTLKLEPRRRAAVKPPSDCCCAQPNRLAASRGTASAHHGDEQLMGDGGAGLRCVDCHLDAAGVHGRLASRLVAAAADGACRCDARTPVHQLQSALLLASDHAKHDSAVGTVKLNNGTSA